jgi:hypothetical protein
MVPFPRALESRTISNAWAAVRLNFSGFSLVGSS